MTEQVHYRIDRDLVKRVKRVCAQLGITPTAAVSMFFAQMAKERAIPFRPGSRGELAIDFARRNRILRDLDDSEGW